jgi:hypothetical protein
MVRIPRWIVPVRKEVRRLLDEGSSYDEVGEELGLTDKQVLMCEQSWQEIHSSYDHTPDEWRPKEFVYEIDEAKAFIGKEVLKRLGDLPDSDLDLLLLYVEGELDCPDNIRKAEGLIEQLRGMVKELG